MQLFSLSVAATLYLCLGLITAEEQPGVQEYDDYDYVNDDDFIPFTGERHDRFDWQLCKALDEREPDNVIASTMSVKLLLSMLYQASGGETKKQLETILQLPKDKGMAALQASTIIKSLKSPTDSYEVDVGSKIYIDKSYQAKEWFQRKLRSYEAFVDRLEFEDTEKSMHSINFWIETVTRGRIRDVITDPGVLQDTAMLLINGVYFKGMWKYPFDKTKTHRGSFYIHGGEKEVTVDFMRQERYFYYTRSQELDSQIIRLPYQGKKFSMYVILPHRKDGLNKLLRLIKPNIIRRHMQEMEQVTVDVILPKFNIEFTADLKSLLQKVGIKNIFERQNDLIGIKRLSRGKNIQVTNVIQKAMIEVNEEGTTAAAVSEILIGNKFGGNDIVFNASHPFVFYIEDEKTGQVLFLGKLVNPKHSSIIVEDKPLHHTENRPPARVTDNYPLYQMTQRPLPASQVSTVDWRDEFEDTQKVGNKYHRVPTLPLPEEGEISLGGRGSDTLKKPVATESPPLIHSRQLKRNAMPKRNTVAHHLPEESLDTGLLWKQ